jgi:RNA polymerase sigma-70 factor (ECF subfamily)
MTPIGRMDAPTSTFDLLERLRAGDGDAFRLLFEKYRRRLAVLIHYKLRADLRGQVEVDDLLQEVFLIASREMDKFSYRSPGSFMAWLARIADHVVIDAARFQGRQKRHAAEMLRFRSVSNPGGPEPVDSRTPSRLLREREGYDSLLGRLNQLPEDYRQVILLAKVEGLSTKEMAERLGRSPEAVAVLLHRAIQRFRQLEVQRRTR